MPQASTNRLPFQDPHHSFTTMNSRKQESPARRSESISGKRRFAAFVRKLRRILGIPSPEPKTDWKAVLKSGAWSECPANAFRELAKELRDSGDLDLAERIATRGTELHPQDLWLAMEHAQVAYARGDTDARLARWQRVIATGGDKAPPKAFINVADIRLAAGDFVAAETIVRQGMELHPDDFNLEERLARLAHAAGFSARAVALWKDLIDRHPDADCAWIHHKIGSTLASEGLFERAAAALNEGLARHPQDEKLLELYAKVSSCLSTAHIPSAAAGDFTAHLFLDHREPFGRGTCSFPFFINDMNRHVPDMLDFARCIAPFRDLYQAGEVDVFIAWAASKHPANGIASRLAKATGKPLLCVDYGFIGPHGAAPRKAPWPSITVWPDSFHFDTTQSSFLENLLNSDDYRPDAEQLARAQDCIARITRHRITSRNDLTLTEPRDHFPDDGRKRVLLLDQPLNDPSVNLGMACGLTFERMLAAALALPDHEVLVQILTKPGDDVQASHLGSLITSSLPPNVTLIHSVTNPYRLFDLADKIFTSTAHAGFEALMVGKEVHCFGAPFYAGWGLTHDHTVVPRRKRRRSLTDIFHLAYIAHSRYFVPDHGPAEIEELLDHLITEQPASSSEENTTAIPSDAPLRIIIVIPGPRLGATGRYIQTLAVSLQATGCKVMVLADGECEPMENGVRWAQLAFDGALLTAALRNEVRDFTPHIVYENGVRSRAQRAALEIVALTGARLAMQSEDDDVQVYENHHGSEAAKNLTALDKPLLTLDEIRRHLEASNLSHSLNVLVNPTYDRWVEAVTRMLCYRLAELHTAIWHPFRERLALEYGVPTMVVPPVASNADFERILPEHGERDRILKRHHIDSASIVIFIGGALYNYSDEYAVFLEALNLTVKTSGASITLVVTPGRSALPVARMARERLLPEIAFTDVDLNDDEIYMEMLKACDVVCSPGLPDSFNRLRLPSRLVKAMAMAKPVLTCRCGFGESLEHGVNAFLMDGADPSQWAQAIALCLDQSTRRKVGEAGRNFAKEHFDSTRVAEQLKAAFFAILEKPARRLSDGIIPEAPGSRTTLLQKSPRIRLRNRHHTTMQDAIHRMAAEHARLDTVVHIGAGLCAELEDYCRLGASRVLLVEAIPDVADALRKLKDTDGNIIVKQAVVAATNGDRRVYQVRNIREDGDGGVQPWLHKPSRLMELMPALRIEAETITTTTNLAAVCEGTDLSTGYNLLVLELNGAEAETLTATPRELLHGFEWIALRACDPPLCEGGATLEIIHRILDDAGFTRISIAPNHAEPDALQLYRAI
jgi:glycosyltransferase involved in cell wall biosynthesis/tetratricopeptide (TPR) repeat protein